MTHLNKTDVINLFPCPTFRTHQKETLENIVDAVNSGYKCFLLGAPTGFGKSPLNIALGRAFNKAYYLTPQNPLIDQLRKDQFCGQYLTEIKGKSHYGCKEDQKLTCDVCLKKIKPDTVCDEDECNYYIQKKKALNSQIMLTNFAYFSLVSGQKSFRKRELMIIDEAHNISEDIVKNMSIIISPHTLPLDVFEANLKEMELIKEKDNFADYQELNDLLLKIQLSCYNKISINEIKIKDNYEVADEKTRKDLEYLAKQNLHLKDFACKIENYQTSGTEEHAYKVDKQGYFGKVLPRITLQPIYARPFMNKKIWNKAEYFILSSATLMDIPLYIYETGLDEVFEENEIKHITVPSTFPPVNRPIINASVGKLTFDNKEAVIPLAVKRVEEILDLEKGNIAVHCHSYENADAIFYKINPKYKERLIRHESGDRQEQLEIWKTSRNKVFLSVNFEEGQDWVGDICTAQILFKVPYLNMGDKRTRIRVNGKHENNWYNNETLKKVIQSYGRAVRSDTDKANFYVVDESFFYLLSKSESIPDFFIETPMKNWEEWKTSKIANNIIIERNTANINEKECGICGNFALNCAIPFKNIFTPINQKGSSAENLVLVGKHSNLALNCKNFKGEIM